MKARLARRPSELDAGIWSNLRGKTPVQAAFDRNLRRLRMAEAREARRWHLHLRGRHEAGSRLMSKLPSTPFRQALNTEHSWSAPPSQERPLKERLKRPPKSSWGRRRFPPPRMGMDGQSSRAVWTTTNSTKPLPALAQSRTLTQHQEKTT